MASNSSTCPPTRYHLFRVGGDSENRVSIVCSETEYKVTSLEEYTGVDLLSSLVPRPL